MKCPSKFAEVPFQNSKWRTTKNLVDTSYLKEHNIKKCSLVKKKCKEAETEDPAYCSPNNPCGWWTYASNLMQVH